MQLLLFETPESVPAEAVAELVLRKALHDTVPHKADTNSL